MTQEIKILSHSHSFLAVVVETITWVKRGCQFSIKRKSLRFGRKDIGCSFGPYFLFTVELGLALSCDKFGRLSIPSARIFFCNMGMPASSVVGLFEVMELD